MGDVVVAPEMHTPFPPSVKVAAIPFFITKNDRKPHLWGMTLRMTQDIFDMTPSHTVMSQEEVEKYESKLWYESMVESYYVEFTILFLLWNEWKLPWMK